jgi:hypothetical protein
MDTRLCVPIEGPLGGHLLLLLHMFPRPMGIHLHVPIEGLPDDHFILQVRMYACSMDTRLHGAIEVSPSVLSMRPYHMSTCQSYVQPTTSI